MSTRLHRVLHLSAGLVCLTGLAPAQADGLKHDPFTRPMLTGPAAPLSANSANAAMPEPVWKPELRAIMLAGPKSIVNVGGMLVGIGEQINGYRLLEVHEETAVFVNNKKRVTLTLSGIEPLRNPPPRRNDHGVAQRRDDSRKPEGK